MQRVRHRRSDEMAQLHERIRQLEEECARLSETVKVPDDLRRLSKATSLGRWHGGHRCDGGITVGPQGDRVLIGSDLPAMDAMLAAEAVNFVRQYIAALDARPASDLTKGGT